MDIDIEVEARFFSRATGVPPGRGVRGVVSIPLGQEPPIADDLRGVIIQDRLRFAARLVKALRAGQRSYWPRGRRAAEAPYSEGVSQPQFDFALVRGGIAIDNAATRRGRAYAGYVERGAQSDRRHRNALRRSIEANWLPIWRSILREDR